MKMYPISFEQIRALKYMVNEFTGPRRYDLLGILNNILSHGEIKMSQDHTQPELTNLDPLPEVNKDAHVPNDPTPLAEHGEANPPTNQREQDESVEDVEANIPADKKADHDDII